MRASELFICTKHNAPAEAELASHRLLLRSGMIRQSAAGIYTFLPLGLRVVRKIENIVREEMEAIGYAEALMPMLQPAELWEESGRWESTGDELFRIADRGGRRYALQPTSEEVATDMARHELRSYRDLPAKLFQIQLKTRDERRPRFGLLRTREFLMKDAYSFHADAADLDRAYAQMHRSYLRVFARLGLRVRAVEADNGNIGGKRSHEFHVLCSAGEDLLAYSTSSPYAANLEAAVARQARTELSAVPVSGMTMDEVAVSGHQPSTQSYVYLSAGGGESRVYLLLLRAEHSLNSTKLNNLPLFRHARAASEEEVRAIFGTSPEWVGPVNLPPGVELVADEAVLALHGFSCGANAPGRRFSNVQWGRDVGVPGLAYDIRNVVEGDPSPDGEGTLRLERGIEVGHIFKLDTVYAKKMGAEFVDRTGARQALLMGSYGIGISRIVAAAIEQSHDEKGIVWNSALAPFAVVICPIGAREETDVRARADALYAQLRAHGIDAVLEDRALRPGAMFSDWDLIGLPYRVVVSKRTIARDAVEVHCRREGTTLDLSSAELVGFIRREAEMAQEHIETT